MHRHGRHVDRHPPQAPTARSTGRRHEHMHGFDPQTAYPGLDGRRGTREDRTRPRRKNRHPQLLFPGQPPATSQQQPSTDRTPAPGTHQPSHGPLAEHRTGLRDSEHPGLLGHEPLQHSRPLVRNSHPPTVAARPPSLYQILDTCRSIDAPVQRAGLDVMLVGLASTKHSRHQMAKIRATWAPHTPRPPLVDTPNLCDDGGAGADRPVLATTPNLAPPRLAPPRPAPPRPTLPTSSRPGQRSRSWCGTAPGAAFSYQDLLGLRRLSRGWAFRRSRSRSI